MKSFWSGGPLPDSSDYHRVEIQDQYVFLAEIRQAFWRRDYYLALRMAQQHLILG